MKKVEKVEQKVEKSCKSWEKLEKVGNENFGLGMLWFVFVFVNINLKKAILLIYKISIVVYNLRTAK